ncbi:MAG: hypothetical protein Q9188_002695 [Gyalolechia gomerana]
MDILCELEDLANEAIRHDGEPTAQKIRQWQSLFGYTYSKALENIKSQRLDFGRRILSDELWRLVQEGGKAEGYDKEAYEHQLDLWAKARPQNIDTDDDGTYVFRFDGPFVDMDSLRAAIGCDVEITQGFDHAGEARFAEFIGRNPAVAKVSTQEFFGHQPNFTRMFLARKELSSHSLYPMLGVDSTLPYRRAQTQGEILMHTEYPVWYFFYGTLTDPGNIKDLLTIDGTIDGTPFLMPAMVQGGIVKLWGGKYKALIDGPSDAQVQGMAYQVTRYEHEETLRFYETDKYEVVRCSIILARGVEFRGLDLPCRNSWRTRRYRNDHLCRMIRHSHQTWNN